MRRSDGPNMVMAIILQAVLAVLFAVLCFLLFLIEGVVMAPLLFILPIGICFLCADAVVLCLTSRKKKTKGGYNTYNPYGTYGSPYGLDNNGQGGALL